MLTRFGRSETICQLERCTFIMDKLLEWQKLGRRDPSGITDDLKNLVKELGNELTGCMAALTRNLKELRLEKEKKNGLKI